MQDDILKIIDKVRRSTRSPDILTICDNLQRYVVGGALIDAARGRSINLKPRLTRAQIQRNYRLRKKEKQG